MIHSAQLLAVCFVCLMLRSCPAIAQTKTFKQQAQGHTLADNFYTALKTTSYWYNGRHQDAMTFILKIVDSASYYGLNKKNYEFPNELPGNLTPERSLQCERQFTAALADFAADIYHGDRISNLVTSDETLRNAARTIGLA